MSKINRTRSFLYALARFLGDVNAVSRGPGAVARRAGRKGMGRLFGRGMGRLF